MAIQKVTHDETCPHCGKDLDALWDVLMPLLQGYCITMVITCPHCEKEIRCDAIVDYRLEAIE